jgi:hypothetical protein
MTRKTLAVLIALVALAAASWALINPNFTPIHLAQQSETILVIEFKDVSKDGKAKAVAKKAVKGKAPAGDITFDFMAGAMEDQGKEVVRMITEGTKEAMLFVGAFAEEGGGGGDAPRPDEARGLLHVGGKWVILDGAGENAWDMKKIDARMLGTWAGSTDMLQRVIDYVLSDPDADVPVGTSEEWDNPVSFGKVDGKIAAIQQLDLTGDGTPWLFVACDKGDRLFVFKDGKFVDATAERKLATKSTAFVWTDINGDGKLDLVSYAPGSLTVSAQQADGTFAPPTPPMAMDREIACIGLSVASGKDARVIVVSTSASPDVLTMGKDFKRLVEGDFPGKDLGKAGACLVADFDGDAIPDIIQPFERGGLFYKGTGPGQFAAPVRTRVALGKGESGAFLGDYDADGLLDVVTAGEDGSRIWQNFGGGKFANFLSQSGEIFYISKAGGIGGVTGDINNDGRQDVFIAYSEMPPQLFFNRGFRSFGHSRSLDLAEMKLLPEADKGQQAACLGDFNRDGAEDMVLALRDGSLWFVPRKVDGKALAVTVELPPGAPFEPVLLTAQQGKRSFGAWSLSAGGSPVFFGLRDAGPVTLTWRYPGAEPQKMEVLVVDKPVRVVLGAKK